MRKGKKAVLINSNGVFVPTPPFLVMNLWQILVSSPLNLLIRTEEAEIKCAALCKNIYFIRFLLIIV